MSHGLIAYEKQKAQHPNSLLAVLHPNGKPVFPTLLGRGLHGCCEGCQASSVTVSIFLVLLVVHTCPVCYNLLAAPFGLAPEQICPGCLQCSDCLQRWYPLAPWSLCSLNSPHLSLPNSFNCSCVRVGSSHPSLSLLRGALPFPLLP